ncbi:MAG: type III pantothenate kinase [Clostridia bacterium]|nr:type III pantothenate kinase [Clostridia bacterium]
MLLTYNIANDEITLGLVADGELVDTVRISTDTKRTADEYACIFKGLFDFRGISSEQIDGAIGSSVVPTLTETVRSALETVLGIRPHLLGAGIKTGLNILTDDPSQLGGDLVSSAVGALEKYTPPLILVNFGTATTFSALDKNGAFVGCAIAPGLTLSAQALSEGTSLLPQFAKTAPKKCIGTNTSESLQSGCFYGNAAMIDGMVERIEAELGESTSVVASGKDADTVTALCKHDIIRDDTLILLGLAKIYDKNSRKKKQK